MKHPGLVAAGAIVLGVVIFTVATPKAEDRKTSWTPVFFDNGGCDGTKADVRGSDARLKWDGSNSVAIAVPAKVRWSRGEGTDVVLHGDEDDLARIRLEDGTLKLCGGNDTDKIEIVLPGRDFHKVTIAGAGELIMDGVDQDDLKLTIAGAGKMTARGRTDEVKLTIAGAGEARLGKLQTQRLKLAIAGAGKADASPSEDADVNIVGAGNVDLLTRPAHHDFNVLGAGDINLPDET